MSSFYVAKEKKIADFLVEKESLEGVKLIAETVREDLRAVTDMVAKITADIGECKSDRVILMATLDHSELLDRLENEGKISLEALRGKREVYCLKHIEFPFAEVSSIKELFVIAGSDKRGTIYGMFRLSELCGVSPLIYFGDATPEKNSEPVINFTDEFVSKEPSVKYRGFFINDEWPAFGNWCMETFGGINAKAYRKIFELLLRLKGNYMWPAMWASTFSEDGPGLLSAELADKLGVVIGLSHHEPMCRAGEEWQKIYSQYGTDSTWSFVTNEAEITEFWKDGILRNKDFENVVTIGMRGENDSKLMPEDATLKDNIEVIKKAIRTQHRLIKDYMNQDLKEVPRMLAIYKEVEDYYFGDETCEGLKDWKELEDVIFLLSDDNYGNLRALPTDEDRNHSGGYGMYYHFDYHGAPISYEWTNCNRLTKTWEMMTQAYESGVREMWIVNVGDLKAVEYPLCYFMELAYDFESWGSSAINKTELFAKKWIDTQFGNGISAQQKELVGKVLEGYTKWNALRTPEAMNEGIYHPVHFRETDRAIDKVLQIMETAEKLNCQLSGPALITYQNMIYYPAMASLNLVMMYLETGLNKELARRGCLYANTYAKSVRKRIENDSKIVEEFHNSNNKKWNHCMSSAHTGFRNWDDNDWVYPTTSTVYPIPGGKVLVGFRGDEKYHLGAHWQDNGPLVNEEFIRPDQKEVILDINSRGNVSFQYQLEYDCPWLLCDRKNGRVDINESGHDEVHFYIERKELKSKDEALCKVQIEFDNGEKTYSDILIKAMNYQGEGQNLFLENHGYCAIRAEHYSEKKDIDGKGFEVINYLGREGAAVKALPAMEVYPDPLNAPYVKYSMLAEKNGEYNLVCYLLSRNPAVKGGRMRFAISINDEKPQDMYGVSENYYTEWFNAEWADGVLDHARTVTTTVSLKEGQNDIYFYAGEPGVILEKLVLYRADTDMKESYLGPQESYCIKN